MDYNYFIDKKFEKIEDSGFDFDESEMNPLLFDFQKQCVKWSLRKGKSALFEECGLGKTIQQLEWSKIIQQKTSKPVIIIAPLGVSKQTVREGEKFGYQINLCKDKNDIINGINITNYEKIEKFDFSVFSGICLDESSILKSFNSTTRQKITELSKGIKYKLCCTATPSPNDYPEIGNHSEFLEIKKQSEMKAEFFVHDSGETQKYRLRGWGVNKFWEWVASWSLMIEKPSDLGFKDDGYILPPIKYDEIKIKSDPSFGNLFVEEAKGLQGRQKVRKESIKERCEKVADIVNNSKDVHLVFCKLNDESKLLTSLIDGAYEIAGNTKEEEREEIITNFANGNIKCLVSKPKICGFGMNFQVGYNMVFTGLSDSFEEFYQSVRRMWRFGQKNQVKVTIVIDEREVSVLNNIKRKQRQFEEMIKQMKTNINLHSDIQKEKKQIKEYELTKKEGENWTAYHGDCVDAIKLQQDNSIDFTIFSPPFVNLYKYSDSERDMGNSSNYDEFFQHFSYLIPEILRTTKPGRLCAVHCTAFPLMKERDGVIGLEDFPGDIVRLFKSFGWIYHAKYVIWKNPLTEVTRTKAKGLQYKELVKDSVCARAGIPDEIRVFRKPGNNLTPVKHEKGFADNGYIGTNKPKASGIKFHHHTWQHYASPVWDDATPNINDLNLFGDIDEKEIPLVWYDINQSDTLNFRNSKVRHENDEAHICLCRDSLILTKRGFVEIQNIEIGDNVFTHKGKWKPVIAKKCTGINETLKLHAQGVPNLILTPNHKIWSRKATLSKPKNSMKQHHPEWVKAKDMQNNYVNLKLPEIHESNLTEKEWWLIGRYLADGHQGGHAYKNGRKSFYISVGDKKRQHFLDMASEYIGTYVEKQGCNQYRLKNLSEELKKTLHRCRNGAINKQIPIEGLCLDIDKSEALLSGYLSGDGHKDKMGTWHCCSVSRGLLLGMAMVVQRARSIIPAVYAGKKAGKHVVEGRFVNQKQLWVMMFNSNPKHTLNEILDDGAWKKTRKIIEVGKNETWNIRVEDDESYTAEGCIVKNCPLQLDCIERLVHMYSKKGETVASWFGGIGSEGYKALEMGRKTVLAELKETYYNQMIINLKRISNRHQQIDLPFN